MENAALLPLLLCRNYSRPSPASKSEERKSKRSSSSSTSTNIKDDEHRVTEPPLPTPPGILREREDGQRGRFLPASAPMALPSCFSATRQGTEVGVRPSRSAAQQGNNSERPRPGNPNSLRNGLLQATSPARDGGGGDDDGGGGGGGGVSRGQDMGAVALLLLAASKASPRPSSDGRGMMLSVVRTRYSSSMMSDFFTTVCLLVAEGCVRIAASREVSSSERPHALLASHTTVALNA